MVEQFFRNLLGHVAKVHSVVAGNTPTRFVLKAKLELTGRLEEHLSEISAFEAGLRARLAEQFGHKPDRNRGVRLTVNHQPSWGGIVVTLSASRTHVEEAALASFTEQVQAAANLLRAHPSWTDGGTRGRGRPVAE